MPDSVEEVGFEIRDSGDTEVERGLPPQDAAVGSGAGISFASLRRFWCEGDRRDFQSVGLRVRSPAGSPRFIADTGAALVVVVLASFSFDMRLWSLHSDQNQTG